MRLLSQREKRCFCFVLFLRQWSYPSLTCMMWILSLFLCLFSFKLLSMITKTLPCWVSYLCSFLKDPRCPPSCDHHLVRHFWLFCLFGLQGLSWQSTWDLVAWTIVINFLTDLEAASPITQYGQDGFLPRPGSLAWTWYHLSWSSQGLSFVSVPKSPWSFLKNISGSGLGFILMTSFDVNYSIKNPYLHNHSGG